MPVQVNPIPDVAGYTALNFILWFHFLQCPLVLLQQKGRDRGCTRRLQIAWPSLGSALETPWFWVSHCSPPMHKRVEKIVLSPCTVHHLWQGSFFPSLGEWLQAECCDYCKFVNGWMWFQSQMCRGWLQEHLCEIWGLKTRRWSV